MALPKLDVPIYTLNLISSDKPIRFRPFLVKEQKLLLMASESDNLNDSLNAIKQIIKNCIMDDIDVDKLAIFDLEYIFLNLRARSVDEVVDLQYKCNNKIKNENNEEVTCGSIEKFKINLLEILPEKSPNHSNKIMLSDTLGMMMKYPTFEVIENLKSQDEEGMLIELLTKSIDSIFDSENIYYAKDTDESEILEFIDNLQQKDLEKLQLFFESAPKIKKSIDFNCHKCGYKENIIVEGLQNFFV
jgi:DNA-directed RNA polymerase subunit M/transcription elongation factor TFIIS